MLEGTLATPIRIPECLPRTDAAWGYSRVQAASEKFNQYTLKKKKFKVQEQLHGILGLGGGEHWFLGGVVCYNTAELGLMASESRPQPGGKSASSN